MRARVGEDALVTLFVTERELACSVYSDKSGERSNLNAGLILVFLTYFGIFIPTATTAGTNGQRGKLSIFT